jgi:hypothetical protein
MEEVLAEEANAIAGAANVAPDLTGAGLYQALNSLGLSALCLSGGGIRSATFSLGVVQALASYARQAEGKAPQADQSLLSEFQYLSTVSGGGYLGGFLSAWLSRAHSAGANGWTEVWQSLTGRRTSPDQQPLPLAWLRSYSNYLTPRVGVASADTWTTIAIYLRNLVLNWLVIVPVVYAAVLFLKLFAIFIVWLSEFDPEWTTPALVTGCIGAVCLVAALRHTCLNRPTHGRSLGGQASFLLRDLIPAVLAAIIFTFAMAFPATEVLARDIVRGSAVELFWAFVGFAFGGGAIYGIGWAGARPPFQSCADGMKDLAAWVVSGCFFGVIILGGIILYFQAPDTGLGYLRPKEILLLAGAVPWIVVAKLIAEILFVGLTSKEDGSDSDREWLGRSAGWYLVVAIVWLITIVLAFVGSDVLQDWTKWGASWLFGGGAGAGVVTALLGKSSLTPASGSARSGKGISLNIVLSIAAPIFAGVLIIGLSALSDYLLFGTGLTSASFFTSAVVTTGWPSWPGGSLLILMLAIVGAVLWAASFWVNINRFSLHALYRNRLIRAYLGASNRDRGATHNEFTGFNEYDNLPIYNLWPQQPAANTWVKVDREHWRPFHLVNIALNVVSTEKLAWQERKAESFTVSALHSGSARLGYRPSATYGDPNGISLGTAVAISGAAVSPDMGYHSSPPVALLLTLFNVRLGWWLGNPGPAGDRKNVFRRDGPPFSAWPLFAEMFGLTNDRRSYVYLSDGGHFENLGLYEMVRRRCRYILIVDAGGDKDFEFEDLGNAIRKIYIDLGISITFQGLDRLQFRESATYQAGQLNLHAVGTIDYPAADGGGHTGTILYIKPAFHAHEITNVGVRSYAVSQGDFPHESTGDQWFTESQFESYRALGCDIMSSVLAKVRSTPNCPNNPALAQIFELLPNTIN